MKKLTSVLSGILLVVCVGCATQKAALTSSSPQISKSTVSAVIAAGSTGQQYLYATDISNNTVSAFAVNNSTGALSSLAVATFNTGQLPIAVAADPSNNFLYTANWADSSVSAFVINSDGSLTPNGSFSLPSGAGPIDITAISGFVYVADSNINKVSAFKINSDGTLNEVSGSPFATGALPSSATAVTGGSITPTLYTANASDNTISIFTINLTDGTLTMAGTVATGNSPQQVMLDLTAHYAYATNLNDNSITIYTVNSSGSLTTASTVTMEAGASPFLMGTSNGYLYITKGNDTVSAYAIGSNGDLTPVSGSPFATGSGPAPILTVLDTQLNATAAYVGNEGNNTISAYSVSSGALTPLSTYSPVNNPGGFALVMKNVN